MPVSPALAPRPLHYQGLGLPHPYLTQGLTQLDYLLQYTASTELSGQLLRTSFAQAQLEYGGHAPLLRANFQEYGHLVTPHTWVRSIWEFVSNNHLAVTTWDTGSDMQGPSSFRPPPKQRENDSYIRELFSTYVQDTYHDSRERREKLEQLNRCRLAAQVVLLSDITTGDGGAIQPRYLSLRDHRRLPYKSSLDWPHHKPTRDDWTLWRNALNWLLDSNKHLHQHLRLGVWIQPSHQNLDWYFDPSSRLLYRHSDFAPGYFSQYSLIPAPGRRAVALGKPVGGCRQGLHRRAA